MRIFSERALPRRVAVFAAACVAVVMSFGLPGNAQAAPGDPVLVGLPWSIVGVGDLDGLNEDDIVWHNANTGETQVWFMNANRIAARSTVMDENGQPIFVGLPWSIVGVGDLDSSNDKADIVWHNAATNETQIWFMNRNRIVQRSTVIDGNGQPIFFGLPWSIVGVGNFDGNFRADLVWHNAATNEIQVWSMIGNRAGLRRTVIDLTGQPALVAPPLSIVGVGAGGVKANLVVHNANTGETQLWSTLSNADLEVSLRATVINEFGQPTFVGLPFSIVGFGDVNGNGEADIVWHNANTGETQIWFMNSNRLVQRATVVE